MNYSVIPYVVGRFRVADWSDGGSRRREEVQLLPTEPIDLQISAQDIRGGAAAGAYAGARIPIPTLIAAQLRGLVDEALEVAANDGIELLLEGIRESPPVKILRDDIENADEILSRSYFQIVGVNGTPLSFAGRERLFKLSPPDLVYDNTKYFEPDSKSMLLTDTGETASCAFQYIYQKFGNKKGFKKLAKDFRTIKSRATTDPPQFHTWAKWYKDELNIEKLNKNIQHGLPDLKSFEIDLVKVDVIGIKDDEWTDDELYNSLSVLDIIRWCMWAKISCYAVDFDGNYYLSYNHNDIVSAYNDKKSTHSQSIVLKVKDNHAYFVDDRNLKISTASINSKWRAVDFDNLGDAFERKKNKKITDTTPPPEKPEGMEGLYEYETNFEKWIEDNSNDFYFSPYFKIRDAINKGYLGGKDLMNQLSYIDKTPDKDGWNEVVAEMSKEIYKHNPPPMPEDFLKDEDKSYYLQSKDLNGIISILSHQYGRTPIMMSGNSAHKIDRCCYGKTRLFSRGCMSLDELPSPETINLIHKNYPNLSLTRIPTYTQIATEIFKKKYDNTLYSYLNSNMRRVFMDGEIKADNRVVKESISSDFAVSLDLKRAYTTAMRDMDVRWSKFDGINQFKRYNGYFSPNYFYLVKEIGKGYPLRGGGGLKLYHGCFLRRLLGKGLVVIKYYSKPVLTLNPGYFKEFIEDCEKIEEFNSKHLINSFIGSIKKDNRIKGFKFNSTESLTTLTRKFYTGSIVSALDRNTDFNRKYRWTDDKPIFLTANACKEYNIQTGQPIRLQIMDKINEFLYKLYHTYKVCLWWREGIKDPKLAMVRTDALYFEDAGIKEPLVDASRVSGLQLKEQEPIPKEDWDFKKQDELSGIMMRPNRWSSVIDVDKRWSIDKGSKLIFNLINRNGAWVQGCGGVGKSELMIAVSKIFARNRIRYKFKKAILREQDNVYWYHELEEWRDKNPCFCIKLAPTNKACNRIGGKTLNKGLGIPVMGIEDDENQNSISYFERIIARIAGDGFKKPVYDYVLIDEISMINGYMWSLLYYIKQRIPRIKFLLCGDIKRQLPPVGEENRDFMNSYLIKEVAGFTKINLNYNFRSGETGNLLWDQWSINPERFQINPEGADTIINLCWTNLTRKRVINELQEKYKVLNHTILKVWDFYKAPLSKSNPVNQDDGQTEELLIYRGARLIANKSMEELGVAKNEVWIVLDFSDDITLSYEGRQIELTKEEVYKDFYSAACITIHKSQGDTYEEFYTIHDWEKLSKEGMMKRRLRYVAQSRSKNPSGNITYK